MLSVLCVLKVKSRSHISVTKNYSSSHRCNCGEYSRTAVTASGSFHLFSIALDESTDIQGTAQLLIYLRGNDENFEIT